MTIAAISNTSASLPPRVPETSANLRDVTA
jgi:hypothetical protein